MKNSEMSIALYDIDRTSYDGWLVYDIMLNQEKSGLLEDRSLENVITELNGYKEKKIKYEKMADNVLLHWARGLKGKKVNDINENTTEFLIDNWGNFFPYVEKTIDLLRETHNSYFVTAEPQFVAREVTRLHNANGFIATIFETKHQRFTGEVVVSLGKADNKLKGVGHLLKRHQYANSLAFGDSDGDAQMLEGVAIPFCVNPNEGLIEIARSKNWKICKPETIFEMVKKIAIKKN